MNADLSVKFLFQLSCIKNPQRSSNPSPLLSSIHTASCVKENEQFSPKTKILAARHPEILHQKSYQKSTQHKFNPPTPTRSKSSNASPERSSKKHSDRTTAHQIKTPSAKPLQVLEGKVFVVQRRSGLNPCTRRAQSQERSYPTMPHLGS